METSQKDDADINARQDEVEALTSIYPGDIELKEDEMIPTSDGDWKLYKQRGAIIAIRPRDDYGLDKTTSLTVRMDVSTPPDYPSRSSPSYRLSAPFLRGEEKEQLIKCLDNRYDDNPGECILFDWIEIIKDHIQQFDANLHLRQAKDLGDPVILSQANIVHIEKNDINDLEMCMTSCDISSLVEDQNKNRNSEGQNKTTICPDIYTSDVIEDRKSVFQGHFARVDDVEKVHLVLDKLKENKKIKNASHPTMYAYRIQQKGKTGYFQDCEDDGESGAGSRLLHLLNMMNANNTLVVVTRWYGGIHLGGDRWKHINNAARNSIEAGTNEEQSQEQKNNTKSKSNNRGKHSKDKKH